MLSRKPSGTRGRAAGQGMDTEFLGTQGTTRLDSLLLRSVRIKLQKMMSTVSADVRVSVCMHVGAYITIILFPHLKQWVATNVRPKSIGREETVHKSMTMTRSLTQKGS